MELPVLKKVSGQMFPFKQLRHNLSWFGFVRVTILSLFVLFFGLPLVWLVLAPTKSDTELIELPPLSFGELSRVPETWNNLMSFSDGIVLTWAWRSLFYATSGTLLALCISLMAGYAFGTTKFKGRKLLLWLTLITMIIPPSSLVLPMFLGANFIGIINTMWAIILPMAFFPFGVYLAFIYYTHNFPHDLLDAGRIDGATEWQIFWKIAFPVAKPLIGLITFLSFTANWNNYFLPFVMLTDDKLLPLPVGLQVLVNSSFALRPTFGAQLAVKRPEVALAALIVVLPVVIVFLFSQRFVVSGIATGSVKE